MSAADYTRVKLGLRKWVEYAVDGFDDPEVAVVFAQQGKPRPPRPYVDITIDAIAQVGRDERSRTDKQGNRTVSGPRVATVTVAAYGPGAIGIAEQVRSALWLEGVHRRLRQQGVSFLQADPVQNGTVELETGLEERGIFSVFFAYRTAQVESVGFAEAIEVAGTLYDVYDIYAEYEDSFWVPESPA